MTVPDFEIGGLSIRPGERRTVDLHVSELANHTAMTLPVHVIHSDRPGPALFLSGAVHGDEIVGVEVVRRVIRSEALASLKGTVLAVPIVNSFGFINHSRYMPDRRDLNRSFPGSDRGSLTSVLADLFLREVVRRSNYGIDLHTAALHRTNLPQIRITPDEPALLPLAEAFGAPVILVSKLREGTLRQCARDHGVRVLLYEGGEALRFDEVAIRAAVVGILRVMKHLGMISSADITGGRVPSAVSHSSAWVRAPEGGILRTRFVPGDRVMHGQVIGEIADPLGENGASVVANDTGIIIGRTNLPIANRGDALFHIARIKDAEESEARIGKIESSLVHAPMADEDEIV